MSKVRTGILYWLQIFLFPIHLLSYLMPRNKRLWAFGSTFGRRFADNPRYMYLYMNQYQKDMICPVWITKNRKLADEMKANMQYKVYYLYTIRGLWTALRAGVYVYDNYTKDICFTLSGHALKVNLWHGVPLKKIQRDNCLDVARHPKNLKQRMKYSVRRVSDEKPWHYVLTTSDDLKSIFESAFGTKNVLVCGYPRNDICNKKIENYLLQEEKQSYEQMLNKNKGKKVILYMPTFRDTESQLLDKVNLNALNDFLATNNLLLCVKFHMKSKLSRHFNSAPLTNIMVISQNADPYVFLGSADILITDYSSIYFDYLIYNRPIIFFNYDMEDYLSESRELYFDYYKTTPGNKCNTINELEKVLISILNNDDDGYSENRMELKSKVLKEQSGIYSETLFMQICNATTKKNKRDKYGK